jgi:hypothetical protein
MTTNGIARGEVPQGFLTFLAEEDVDPRDQEHLFSKL